MINMDLKIPENKIRYIFQGGFWSLYMQFSNMGKFSPLDEFLVDNLSYPFMSGFVLLFC